MGLCASSPSYVEERIASGAIEVNLGCNSLGDNDAERVAEALKVNTTLQTLYLLSNKITDEGARHLAEALKVNTALQKLDLRCWKKRTRGGACHLAEALEANYTLQQLHGAHLSDRSSLTRNQKLAALFAEDASGPLAPDEVALLQSVTEDVKRAALVRCCLRAGRIVPANLLPERGDAERPPT